MISDFSGFMADKGSSFSSFLSGTPMIIVNKLKGSSFTPPGVILTPNDYKEYLYLTQAAKSAFISSVARTNNASSCLSHSSRPWILDSRASNHLSDNKDIFSSLTCNFFFYQ